MDCSTATHSKGTWRMFSSVLYGTSICCTTHMLIRLVERDDSHWQTAAAPQDTCSGMAKAVPECVLWCRAHCCQGCPPHPCVHLLRPPLHRSASLSPSLSRVWEEERTADACKIVGGWVCARRSYTHGISGTSGKFGITVEPGTRSPAGPLSIT